MRLSSYGLLVMLLVATMGFAVLWFLVGGTDRHEDADATLARLSKQGGKLTYYARYEGIDQNDSSRSDHITIYTDPGVGFRVELSSPLAPKSDADQPVDVLKSGDIFIANLASPASYISCRTERQSCRTADGLEVIAVLDLLTLFRFDQPFFAQPHTVTRTNDISAVRETAKCFVITQRVGSANEQATAESSGFVPGEGLPKTFCYANDGVPLGGLVADTKPNNDWIKATELRREVDPKVFTPPFAIVPSVYDRTPTAQPLATPTTP